MELRQAVDQEAIVEVARRWAEAWHAGDFEAMAACLHPDLDHRILQAARGSGQELRAVRDLLGIQAGLGPSLTRAGRRADVKVLDARGRSASVRVDLGPWCAFVHLAARQGGWGIASVLWEWQGNAMEQGCTVMHADEDGKVAALQGLQAQVQGTEAGARGGLRPSTPWPRFPEPARRSAPRARFAGGFAGRSDAGFGSLITVHPGSMAFPCELCEIRKSRACYLPDDPRRPIPPGIPAISRISPVRMT
jgi:hypothetical protein